MATSIRTSPFGFSTHANGEKTIASPPLIQNHVFNHALTVILPGVTVIPQEIQECLVDQLTYKVHQLPLYRLIEKPFIQAFVKNGAMHMLSLNTRLDTDNCVVLTPTGWLILNLTKDTYQELGLEARKQTHREKQTDTFVVRLNLLADSFRPGKKGYERTLWCLKDRLGLKFDFLISWEPHEAKVCSSSVGVYFVDKCKSIQRLDLQRTSRVCTSLPCPRIDMDQPEGSENSCHYQEVFDWMGALACGVELTADEIGPGSYTSTFICPEPKYNCPRCCVFQASGMITPNSILRVWKILRDYVSSHPECLPASLTVHGFADCPVLYKTLPHQFYVNGENLYSLLLLTADTYWSYNVPVS